MDDMEMREQADGSGPCEAEVSVRFGAAMSTVSTAQAALIDAAVALVIEVRDRVLVRKGLVGVELGRTTAKDVLAEVKRCAVLEVQIKGGYGVQEARSLVGLALAQHRLRGVITEGMRRGEASWPLVQHFWQGSGQLTEDQRHLVATSLFGDDEDLAVEERRDVDGRLRVGEAWSHAEFRAACDREITAAEGLDVAAERERRRRAYAARTAHLRLHDDGTGTLSIRGPVTTLAAIHERIDTGARNARGSGDERTLANLRCDISSALLLYGTVAIPPGRPSAATGAASSQSSGDVREEDAPDAGADTAEGEADVPDGGARSQETAAADVQELFDDLIAPEQMDRLIRIINALPEVSLQVVVPLDVLTGGRAPCPHCGAQPSHSADPPPPAPQGNTAEGAVGPPDGEPPDGKPPDGKPSNHEPPHDEPPEWMRVLADLLPRGPGRGLVGEVLGPVPVFISPGQARELALTPGTALHRIVTDPLDGRCVERTREGYRPDAQMRRQIRAADVYSRFPGSRTHFGACELDHVTPWGWAGGPTGETNLATLEIPAHQAKTLGHLDLTINCRRDLTFTTLLGQIVGTRTHDYTQYLHARAADDLEARRDLANRAVYAAYAARTGQPGQPGQPGQNVPPPRGLRRPREPGDAWITLTHSVAGQHRPGAAPDTPALADLLGIPEEEGGDR